MIKIGKIRTPVEALFGQCDSTLLIDTLQILKLLNFREFPRTFTYNMWKYIKSAFWNWPCYLPAVYCSLTNDQKW